MSTRTVVHLVRHGEVFNPDRVLYGRLPGFHLSETGHAMAARLALHFASRDVASVTASPLQRAQETATPIAEALDLPLGTEPRIIEAGNDFEGAHIAAGRGSLRDPRVWPRFRNPLRPSWGEPYVEQVARMSATVRDARDAFGGRESVLVSHQLPVWVTRLRAEERPLWHDPRKRQCALASITSLEFAGRRLVAVSYQEPCADLLVGADPVPGPDVRGRSLAVAVVTATALLAGCSGGDGLPASSTVGYVEGDGTSLEIAAGDRTTVVTLSGRTAEGSTVDLESLRGKPVVLNLWYANCAPCREEAPVLEKVSQEYSGRASFVGINSRDDADGILAFQKSRGTTYPSIVDADGTALLALRGVAPKATPTTVVLDADGYVAAQFAGAIDATTLGDLIDGALDTGAPA